MSVVPGDRGALWPIRVGGRPHRRPATYAGHEVSVHASQAAMAMARSRSCAGDTRGRPRLCADCSGAAVDCATNARAIAGGPTACIAAAAAADPHPFHCGALRRCISHRPGHRGDARRGHGLDSHRCHRRGGVLPHCSGYLGAGGTMRPAGGAGQDALRRVRAPAAPKRRGVRLPPRGDPRSLPPRDGRLSPPISTGTAPDRDTDRA